MDRDLEEQKQSICQFSRGLRLLSPSWPFREAWGPDPELQGFYHAEEDL